MTEAEKEAIENLRKVRSCGDLISRKALMQSLRNNVLVDVTPNLEQAIEELPTAYDVDKVVDQLSKEYTNIENDELFTSAEKEAALCRITRDMEIVAEEVAKDVVKSVGKNMAGTLVEYANLAKDLAANLTDEQLEDSEYIKNLLSEELPDWGWNDWYELLKNVRRKKYEDAHEEQTAEKILNDMPYFAKEAAKAAVRRILEAERAGTLFAMDEKADTAAEILWHMFTCCIVDVKMAAEKYSAEVGESAVADLLGFIKKLRKGMWQKGEVLKLREEK